MKLADLQTAVRSGAALRCRTTIQPAGGPGDKVFPPTYLGAKYATEERLVTGDGEPKHVPCVLLDSVQSQANRMEEALQEAVDTGRIKLPVIEVDFSGIELIDPVGKVTSLQAPHRIADAILRDSLYEGKPFRTSEIGKQIDAVSNRNATPLLELCPTALVFGVWDSTGPKGGLGAKFARALVSEVVGYNAASGVKTGSRIDPLEIRASAQIFIEKDGSWRLAKEKEKKTVSPSEKNHGNIPPTIDSNAGGVTISHAEQSVVISMPAFRRLRFPVGGQYKPEYDNAAQTLLVSLSLLASTLASEAGMDLRSRCILWPSETPTWELLTQPGTQPQTFELTSDKAIALYNDAMKAVISAGLPYRTEPVVLTPSDSLTKLLQRSQEIAAESDSSEEA
ncbi:type I-U CRISPR-associated RAMP protein Csb1/Cas7u [Rosistilla oblonga]|uniref:type I-G CRISPR-associated RAMP protein Csb1/Cas7g n=1 Tax=Rosistilla oblonga TaxID=2527990 RepID=UPI003A96FAC4